MPKRTEPSWCIPRRQPDRLWLLVRQIALVLFVGLCMLGSAAGILVLSELHTRDIAQRVYEQQKPCAGSQQFSYATGAACASTHTP